MSSLRDGNSKRYSTSCPIIVNVGRANTHSSRQRVKLIYTVFRHNLPALDCRAL